MAALPEEIRNLVSFEHTYFADLPGVEVIVEGVDPRALLLLDAAPPESVTEAEGETTEAGAGARPTRVFIYQRNIERVTTQIDGLAQELTSALEREIRSAFLGESETPRRSRDA
jgi:hypothetical protein